MNFYTPEELNDILKSVGIITVSDVWTEDLKSESDIIIFLASPQSNFHNVNAIKLTIEKQLSVEVVTTRTIQSKMFGIIPKEELWVWCNLK